MGPRAEPSTFTPQHPLPTPVHALIIGINNYQSASPSWKDLKGCVPDAKLVCTFLQEALGVPKENITTLFDEQATRVAIIRALEDLARPDNGITKDNAAIIIYFAGHGARTPKPSEWTDWHSHQSMIELICPSDMGLESTDKEIQGIPDRTMAALINKLSSNKGNNITLILDSCSSSGATRSQKEVPKLPDFLTPRRIEKPPSLRGDCDVSIWRAAPRHDKVASGFADQHRGSHILLAACGREEQALENRNTKRGLFTSALLKLLNETRIEDLSYTSLMHRLTIRLDDSESEKQPTQNPPVQNPHCEGEHANRRLFNSKASGADRLFLQGQIDDADSITIAAGQSLGIESGTKMNIYNSNISGVGNQPLGILVVGEVRSTSHTSFLKPIANSTFTVPARFYAKEASFDPRKRLDVYSEEKEHWGPALGKAAENPEHSGLNLVENPEAADICISTDGNKIHFDRQDKEVTERLGSRFPHSLPLSDSGKVMHVLQSAARFKYHLQNVHGEVKDVRVELHRLKGSLSHEPWHRGRVVYAPIGEDLIASEPASVVVDAAYLGLTIHNNSKHNFYPHVFFFDPSDLSIQEWYVPPRGTGRGDVDPPLSAHSKLTIGYGDGGSQPWQFYLRDGEDIDVVFLKVFLTTSSADFSSIVQQGPFAVVHRSGSAETPVTSTETPETNEVDPELWATMSSTIVQHRHEPT